MCFYVHYIQARIIILFPSNISWNAQRSVTAVWHLSFDDLFGAKPSIIGKILQSKFKLLITPCAPPSAATTV